MRLPENAPIGDQIAHGPDRTSAAPELPSFDQADLPDLDALIEQANESPDSGELVGGWIREDWDYIVGPEAC